MVGNLAWHHYSIRWIVKLHTTSSGTSPANQHLIDLSYFGKMWYTERGQTVDNGQNRQHEHMKLPNKRTENNHINNNHNASNTQKEAQWETDECKRSTL